MTERDRGQGSDEGEMSRSGRCKNKRVSSDFQTK